MSEKTRKLNYDDIKISVASVFSLVDEECFVCGDTIEATSETEEGLVKVLDEKGITRLESDHFNSVGYYCGCSYELD